jgi:Cof subfamily protein (haloacid dehalogenase superfamily)
MSNIELVLTDFDGTVVQFGKHIVSDTVREAVIACEEQGVKVVPVTGRYYGMAHSVLELLGFDGLGIFDNGASIIDCKTGDLVWSQWLATATVQKVAQALAPLSISLDFTPDHDEHEPADNEQERIAALSEPTSHVFSLVAAKDIEAAQNLLDEIPGITYYLAPSTYTEWPDAFGFQITHERANKFHGAEALRGLLGIPKERTLAIGDGANDLPLFENAGLKIAMGNATDALKAQADHEVATVDEDGFAEAMARFVLTPQT